MSAHGGSNRRKQKGLPGGSV